MNIGEVHLNGRVSMDGEHVYIHENSKYRDYLSIIRGRDVIITIRPLGSDKRKGNLGYYWGVVLKEVQTYLTDYGYFNLTLRDIDDMLREQITITNDVRFNTLGELFRNEKRISDLNNEELSDYLFFVKIWCAENLQLYIKDPIQ